MQVHLELAAAVAAADPTRRILQERVHLGQRQADQPLEADRARPGLLHANGRGELRPHARELREDLPAAWALEPAVDQVALEVWLDQVPAPRGHHLGPPWIMGSSGGTLRA